MQSASHGQEKCTDVGPHVKDDIVRSQGRADDAKRGEVVGAGEVELTLEIVR